MATSGATGTAVLSSWSNALAQLATVVVDPEMRECIGNPRLDPSQLTQLCLNVLGAEAALTVDQQNFVGVLVDNGRLVVLP
ncbi:MAG TPA: F0F1 ATP synthase subunit delta, partial [Rhodocyclaceae bacterium]|nr:F0F1 ATP synthase subunit delta [Rhodocyclaceae bacterium]